MGETKRIPEAAGDEKSGESEEEDDAEPAGLGDVAEESNDGGGRL